MGTGKKEDNTQAQLNAQNALWQQKFLEYLQQANKPDPATERLNAENLAFLDFESGKSGPVDVTKAPGLGASLNLFERAKAGQEGERMGTGAVNMAAGANPALSANLKQQAQSHREQDAAGALSNAYRMRRAEVRGSILPIAEFNQSRNLNLAGMVGSQSQFAGNQWLQWRRDRAQDVPFWKTLLLAGIAGGSQIGAAYLGRP